jgi:hypothetical protein
MHSQIYQINNKNIENISNITIFSKKYHYVISRVSLFWLANLSFSKKISLFREPTVYSITFGAAYFGLGCFKWKKKADEEVCALKECRI